MNSFSYSITTSFIRNNKDYHSYHNFHLVYQMFPISFSCFRIFSYIFYFLIYILTKIMEINIINLIFHNTHNQKTLSRKFTKKKKKGSEMNCTGIRRCQGAKNIIIHVLTSTAIIAQNYLFSILITTTYLTRFNLQSGKVSQLNSQQKNQSVTE